MAERARRKSQKLQNQMWHNFRFDIGRRKEHNKHRSNCRPFFAAAQIAFLII